jgi:hypothetical protein
VTEEELEQRRRSLGEEVKRLMTAAGMEARPLTEVEAARLQKLNADCNAIQAELDARFYRHYMNRPRPPGVEWSRRDGN